jgi:hypothetical protein
MLLYSRLTNCAKPGDQRKLTLLVVKTKQLVTLTISIPSQLLWVLFNHKVHKDHQANFVLRLNPLCSSCSLWLIETVQN